MAVENNIAIIMLASRQLVDMGYMKEYPSSELSGGGPGFIVTADGISAVKNESLPFEYGVDPFDFDPEYPVEDRRHEVFNGDTVLGYWEWRAHLIEANEK